MYVCLVHSKDGNTVFTTELGPVWEMRTLWLVLTSSKGCMTYFRVQDRIRFGVRHLAVRVRG